ncbi:hypothetical protein BD309DRAFT_439440 [Dichomitus squalens]|nr:hypothetical protein BD309DRAFT_439440 [Dichomitus squalens]
MFMSRSPSTFSPTQLVPLPEYDVAHDLHLVRDLPTLPTTASAPSHYVLAAFPTFKSKHILIQAPAHRANASSSGVTESAAVVETHWHQVGDCAGFSKRLQRKFRGSAGHRVAIDTSVRRLSPFQRARKPRAYLSSPGLSSTA